MMCLRLIRCISERCTIFLVSRTAKQLVRSNFRAFMSTGEQAVTLAYERYEARRGNTPLLVIHGLFGSRRNWGTFCKTYNEISGREIIALDCRNHGVSEQSPEMSYPLMCYDIEKTLIQTNIPKAVVLGHSMGGKVAMNLALSMPCYVEKLVVVDVSHSPGGHDRVQELQGHIRAMLNVDLSQVKSRKDVDTILEKSIPAPELRGFLLTNLTRDKLGNFAWQLNLKGLQENLEELMAEVELNGRQSYEGETLFVAGGNSDYVKPGDLPSIRGLFPKASLEVIEGAGHLVHAEKPKKFLQIIDRFLT